MKTLDLQPSRRRFIQQLGLGAARLGLAANAPLILANNADQPVWNDAAMVKNYNLMDLSI